MNLIEQLGGYDKAKAEFKALKKHPELYSGEFAKNDALLLEHRRTNNIFEIGDNVVYADAEFYEVVGIQGSRNIAVKVINSDFTMSIVSKHCRHATGEEIEAGRRL